MGPDPSAPGLGPRPGPWHVPGGAPQAPLPCARGRPRRAGRLRPPGQSGACRWEDRARPPRVPEPQPLRPRAGRGGRPAGPGGGLSGTGRDREGGGAPRLPLRSPPPLRPAPSPGSRSVGGGAQPGRSPPSAGGRLHWESRLRSQGLAGFQETRPGRPAPRAQPAAPRPRRPLPLPLPRLRGASGRLRPRAGPGGAARLPRARSFSWEVFGVPSCPPPPQALGTLWRPDRPSARPQQAQQARAGGGSPSPLAWTGWGWDRMVPFCWGE